MCCVVCCRCEEEALVARQKAADVDAAMCQLASTLPAKESKALAKVNGEKDGSSVSSGIVQVLKNIDSVVSNTRRYLDRQCPVSQKHSIAWFHLHCILLTPAAFWFCCSACGPRLSHCPPAYVVRPVIPAPPARAPGVLMVLIKKQPT